MNTVVVVVAAIFISGSYERAMAAETRVVVNISIGTGIVVGAVGLFIHLGYSSGWAMVEYGGPNRLKLFPDIRAIPLNEFDKVPSDEIRREDATELYFIGIRW